MTTPFQDVHDFMAIGHPDQIAPHPKVPDVKVRKLCESLIIEEIGETLKAMAKGDMVETSDGIVDSIYVLIYAAKCYGIPIAGVWDEVQRTNMAKFPGGKVKHREDGKILKPEGWEPPKIAAILEAAKGPEKEEKPKEPSEKEAPANAT